MGHKTEVSMETDKDPAPPPTQEKKFYIDSTFLYSPREGVEMKSPLKDGLSTSTLSILCYLFHVKLAIENGIGMHLCQNIQGASMK